MTLPETNTPPNLDCSPSYMSRAVKCSPLLGRFLPTCQRCKGPQNTEMSLRWWKEPTNSLAHLFCAICPTKGTTLFVWSVQVYPLVTRWSKNKILSLCVCGSTGKEMSLIISWIVREEGVLLLGVLGSFGWNATRTFSLLTPCNPHPSGTETFPTQFTQDHLAVVEWRFVVSEMALQHRSAHCLQSWDHLKWTYCVYTAWLQKGCLSWPDETDRYFPSLK